MSRESKLLITILASTVILMIAGYFVAKAQPTKPVEVKSITTEWMARCGALEIKANQDITVKSVVVASDAIRAMVEVGKKTQWLQCRRIGNHVFACQGPQASKIEMAKSCTVTAWTDVPKLTTKELDPIKAGMVCCGEATVGGETRTMWPCGWKMAQVIRLDGYGPGVVGSESPCQHIPVKEPVEPAPR